MKKQGFPREGLHQRTQIVIRQRVQKPALLSNPNLDQAHFFRVGVHAVRLSIQGNLGGFGDRLHHTAQGTGRVAQC